MAGRRNAGGLRSHRSACSGREGNALLEQPVRSSLSLACVLFLGLQQLVTSTASQLGTVCPVQTTAAFFSSLANASCDIIVINGQGFILSRQDMLPFVKGQADDRVTVSRNVTIRGETNTTYLDVAHLKRRIGVDAGMVMRLESLVVPHARAPSGTSSPGLDILYLNATSVVSMENVTLVYPLCTPLDVAAMYAGRVPRPIDYPGNQSFLMFNTTATCIPGLSNFTAQDSGLGAGTLQVAKDCFGDYWVMYDYALAGTVLDHTGVRLASGSVVYLNVTYVCEHYPSAACVNNGSGLAACVSAAEDTLGLRYWDTYDLGSDPSPSPPPGTSGGDSDGATPILAIVLPCVLGGVALLALVVGGVVWTRRRQRNTPLNDKSGRESGLSPGDHRKGSVGKGAGLAHGGYASIGEEAAAGPHGVVISTAEDDGAGSASWGGDSGNNSKHNSKWAAATNGNAEGGNGSGKGVGGKGTGNGYTGAGGGIPPMAARSSTLSSMQSATVTGTGLESLAMSAAGGSAGTPGNTGGGGGGAPVSGVGMEAMLANPLLLQGGTGGALSAGGSGVALNMVLGVDVVASREAVVGRGTFATVLEGHMGSRKVAVKMFHRDAMGGTAEDVKSLKQEIAIMARCRHPNVVTLLGAGSTPGGEEVFLVEELMVSNLARVCHEGDGLSLHRVLSVARDIAAGLAYLHPTVIHRDLKPANVLLDRHDNAKLTDFGLSRLWASTVHTVNPEAGTVQYMAPECFSGSLSEQQPIRTPITHLSDIYSFGVMLWEMLANERPWRGMTSIQVALAVGYEQQRLKMPEGDNPRFHPKLRKLVLQCWEADPRKRPGAAEIAKRLSLLLQQLEAHGSLDGPAVESCTNSFTCGNLPGPNSRGSSSAPAPVSNGSAA